MSTVAHLPVTPAITDLPTQTLAHTVAAKAGISYKRVDFWTRCGLIPGHPRFVGHGVPRTYTDEQTAFVVRLAQLVHAGIGVRQAAQALTEQTIDGHLPTVIRLAAGIEIHLTVPAFAQAAQ